MTFFGILKAIIPLLLIVALLYGVLIVVKKYGLTFRGRISQGSPNIKLISSQMIMPKKFISVVKVEEKLLVLGISEHSINLLKELEPSALPQKEVIERFEKDNFLSILKKNLGLK
ncbi:MAG TPA: flagellar biosynthetic protein FliO [Ignavibacteriaceae bacterium]|nr:flagellar biosynthetic protein FliO [Ignavibacteriaceae bacterium]